MSIEDIFEAQIKSEEGCKLVAYYDTAKVPNLTIGYGHRIRPSDCLKEGSTITQYDADDYLRHDLAWVFMDATTIFQNFNSMPQPVQLVIYDMLYNNGKTQFLGFHKMVAAAKEGNWLEMANQIVDSDDYRNKYLHPRYEKLQLMVRGCV